MTTTTKYTPEITRELVLKYQQGATAWDLARWLEVPERSVIAKLSSLGVYQRKSYVNKNGLPPVKKSEYIDQLAELLDTPADQLESLEKVNKRVLQLLIQRLQAC